MAVSGNTVVVGAHREDSSATGVNGNQADNSAAESGAAYVFVRGGGVWSHQAYLKASNTGTGDSFGFSVAVSGETVVVGARTEDSSAMGVNGNQADNGASNSGAAYVFWGVGPCCPGDMNRDYVVTIDDIPDFVTALLATSPCPVSSACCPADCDTNGVGNGLDIQPFVNKLLSGGACP